MMLAPATSSAIAFATTLARSSLDRTDRSSNATMSARVLRGDDPRELEQLGAELQSGLGRAAGVDVEADAPLVHPEPDDAAAAGEALHLAHGEDARPSQDRQHLLELLVLGRADEHDL